MKKAQSDKLHETLNQKVEMVSKALSIRYPAIALTMPNIITTTATMIVMNAALNIVAEMAGEQNEN